MTGTRLPVLSITEGVHRHAKWAGTPSAIIKLMDAAHPAEDVLWLAPAEIGDEVRRRKPRHVVITGAEPCAYDLEPLTRALNGRAFTVQIETTGIAEIRAWPGTWITLTPRRGASVEAFDRASEIQMSIADETDVPWLKETLKAGRPRDRVVWLLPVTDAAMELCVQAATVNHWRVAF